MAHRIPSSLRTTIIHTPYRTTPRALSNLSTSSRPYTTNKTQTATPIPRPSESSSPHQNRSDIVVDNQEYIKSGFDSWASQTQHTAFSKENLTPEQSQAKAAEESAGLGAKETSPLDVSAANKEVSEGRDDRKGGVNIGVEGSGLPSGASRGAKNAQGVKKYQDGSERELMKEGSSRWVPPRTPS